MIKDTDLECLARMLQLAGNEGFTGNIQINFYKGSVANINKQEKWELAEIVDKFKI